jgi:hypothetical protein
MLSSIKEYVFVQGVGVIPVLIIDLLKFFFPQLPPDPAVKIRLTVSPEHLEADGYGSPRLFESANCLQLCVMVALSGVQLADENQSGFGEIFDYIRKGYYLAVCYPKDSMAKGSMAAKSQW